MSLPRYAEYKDSGLAWLGEVPAHWDIAPLKRMLDIQNGSDHKHIEVDDGYPVIGSGGPFAYASEYIYDGESVLLGRKGTVDRPLYVTGKFWTVDTMYWTKICPDASGKFCYYAALTIPFDLYSTNTALPSMTKGVLSAHRIARPSFEEQSAIATFLDRETGKIDALIAEQEKLLTRLAEKRQATISHAVTRGLKNLPGADLNAAFGGGPKGEGRDSPSHPDAQMKDSGVPWLGEVPAHWNVTPLKYLVSLKSGGTPSKGNLDYWDGDVPWASARDLKTDMLSDTTEHLTSLAVASGAATLLPAGAVLVVVRGMILARMFPVSETLVPMAINQDLKAVLPKVGLNGSFLAWLLRGTADESLQRLDEAGHGTKALRMEAWTSMYLPVPPEAEQREIVAFIVKRNGELDSLARESERAIALLKERRSALIAAAVTGKIDVREAVEVVA